MRELPEGRNKEIKIKAAQLTALIQSFVLMFKP
jgi:hypothetical protein